LAKQGEAFMKLVDRYIGKTILASITLVVVLLTGLQIFILFVNQLDDIGRAEFTLTRAAYFVLLQAPYQVYLFFPVACLLGSLVGLGLMASHRELIVMRAAGMSVLRIAKSVLQFTLLLIVIVTALGETLVPKMAYYANDVKMLALSGGQTLRTSQGVWIRHKNEYISIGSVVEPMTLKNVFQYRFDEQNELIMARHMGEIVFEGGQWIAHQVQETVFNTDHTATQHHKQMTWDIPVQPKILKVTSAEPDEMSLKTLWRFIQVKKVARENTLVYKLAFWQRLMQPFSAIVMIILAIPFIFGPLRSSTMGSKFLAGATAGFGFHLLNKFFGPLSQVFQLSPIIAAIAPTCIFAIIALMLMRRVA
jgi:lipopolysaccharide export system permease protein